MRDRGGRGQGRYLHWHSDDSCLGRCQTPHNTHYWYILIPACLAVNFLIYPETIKKKQILKFVRHILYWHIRTPVTWGMSLSWSGCQMSAVTRGPGGSIILFGVWLKNCNFPGRPSHHDGWLAPDKIHQTRFTDRVSDESIKSILDKTVDKWALQTAVLHAAEFPGRG